MRLGGSSARAIAGVMVVAFATQCGEASRAGTRSGGPSNGGDAGDSGGGTAGSAGSSGRSGAAGNGGSAGDGGTAGEGGVAGAGGDGDAGTGGDPDETPPTILSTSPAHGESGVRKDANIVVTFSEPMDRAATEASFKSRRLDARAVTFRWNDAGSVLTIDPNADLEYAFGLDLGYAPLDYYFWFDGPARDLAGNPLAQPTPQVAFTTLRDLQLFATPEGSLDAHCTSYECTDNQGVLVIGDGDIDQSFRGFLSFDLGALPEGLAPEHVQSATLRVHQQRTSGADGVVYGTGPNRLGELLLEQVDHGSTLEPSDYDTPVLDSLGAFFTTDEPGVRASDVTELVQRDLVARAPARIQFRLRFTLETNGNGEIEIAHLASAESTSNPPVLEVLALFP